MNSGTRRDEVRISNTNFKRVSKDILSPQVPKLKNDVNLVPAFKVPVLNHAGSQPLSTFKQRGPQTNELLHNGIYNSSEDHLNQRMARGGRPSMPTGHNRDLQSLNNFGSKMDSREFNVENSPMPAEQRDLDNGRRSTDYQQDDTDFLGKMLNNDQSYVPSFAQKPKFEMNGGRRNQQGLPNSSKNSLANAYGISNSQEESGGDSGSVRVGGNRFGLRGVGGDIIKSNINPVADSGYSPS